MKTVHIFALALSLCTQTVFSYSLSDRSLEDLFEESNAVVGAKIVAVEGKCNPDYCNFIYELTPTFVSKGELRNGTSFSACSDINLEIGLQHILFIEKGQKDVNGILLCEQSIPRDGAFVRFGHRVYRYGSFDATILVEYDEALYQTKSILVPGFDEFMNKINNKSE